MQRREPGLVNLMQSKLWPVICVGAAASCLALAIQLYTYRDFSRFSTPGGALTLILCVVFGVPAGLYGFAATQLLSKRSQRLQVDNRKLSGLRQQVADLEQAQFRQRERIDELATLREVAYVVNRETDFSIIAEKVLELVAALVEPIEASIFLIEQPGTEPMPFAQYVDGKFRSGKKILTRVIPDFHLADFESQGVICRPYGEQFNALVPLKVDEEILGVLMLVFSTDSRPANVRIREFNASRRPLLQEIAQHISLAVKAKHLHMKSVTDGLTLLYSKSHFSRQLDAHVDFAVRNAQPFSLILLDIDHFKQVNDNYGHASGDVVLSGIAETIRNSLRKYDSAYRIGGEELAVLLPRTDLGRAAAIAERLRTRIEKQKFVAKENLPIRVTVSCGVAQYHAGDTSETLFSRTDQCLYSAKENGRNCIATEAA